jgi:hypothetical protein
VKSFPTLHEFPRVLRIERGELVDGEEEKSSKEKISEEKEALTPRA